MSVESLLSGARGAGLLLTIDWKIPSAFLFGLGAAVRPTQMLMRMKRPGRVVSALWPMECAFKGDSQAVRISQRLFGPMVLCKTSIFFMCFYHRICTGLPYLISAAWCFTDPSITHCLLSLSQSSVTEPRPASYKLVFNYLLCKMETFTQTGSQTWPTLKPCCSPVQTVLTRCVHSTVGAMTPALKQYEKLSSAPVNTSISADMTGPLNLDEYKSGGHSETTGSYSILVESVCPHKPCQHGIPPEDTLASHSLLCQATHPQMCLILLINVSNNHICKG